MQLYDSVVHFYFIYRLTVWDNTSQLMFLNYINCKTKPLKLLLKLAEMKLLLFFIKLKKSFFFIIIVLS